MCQTAVEGLICFATGGVCVLLGIVVDGGGVLLSINEDR